MALVGTKPVRIQIEGDDEWVEIKPKLGAADRTAIEDALLEYALTSGEDRPDVKVRMGKRRMAILRAAIVGWNQMDGDTGEPVKFTKQAIDLLDPDDPLTDKVYDEILDRNPTLRTAAAS